MSVPQGAGGHRNGLITSSQPRATPETAGIVASETCGLPHRHSAPALLSEDALPADTNQLASSTPEDGCQIKPCSRDAKLKKKRQKTREESRQPSAKPAIFSWISRNTSAFKSKRGEKTKPLLFHKHRKHSDEVQNSNLTSKAFLLASYPQILAQPTGKPVGSAILLPDDGTQPAEVWGAVLGEPRASEGC